MFGLKNPQKMFGMLKMFGIDLKTIIPAGEKLLTDEWRKWETEAGARLIAVAERKDGDTLEIALFKDEGEGNLSLWRRFDLAQLDEFLNNLEKEKNNVQQIAFEPGGGESLSPQTSTISPEPPAPGTGNAAGEPYDEHPAFH